MSLATIPSIFAALLDYLKVSQEGQAQMERFQAGQERLTQADQDVRAIMSGSTRPSFTVGGSRFGGGGPAINLDKYFTSADVFNQAFDPLDLSGYSTGLNELGGKLGGILGNATQAGAGEFLRGENVLRNTVAPVGSTFEHVDFPDFSGEAFRAKALGDIAAQSGAAQAIGRAQDVGQGFASGRGLQEIQGNMAAAQRARETAAGGAARDVESEIERNRLTYGAQRAGLQAQLAEADASRNAALATAIANQAAGRGAFIGDMTGRSADLLSNLGKTNAQMLFEAIMQQQLSKERGAAQGAQFAQSDALNAISTMFAGLNLDAQQQQALANLIAGIATGQASGQFNYDQNYPLLFPAVSNIVGQATGGYEEPEQKGSFGLSVLGTGGSFGCVDGDALVSTPTGSKALKDVQIGEHVKGTDGVFHDVERFEFGSVPEGHRESHILLTTSRGAVRITENHPIGGKPAKEWKADNYIPCGEGVATVLSVKPCEYVHSGDLMLKGNVPYLANGIPIDSVIGMYKEADWKLIVNMAKIRRAVLARDKEHVHA